MGHEGSGSGGGGGSGVGGLGAGIGAIIAASKKRRRSFDPKEIGFRSLTTQAQIAAVESRIETDVRLGNSPSDADLRKLASLNAAAERQEERFAKQQADKRRRNRFIRAGFGAITTLADFVQLLSGTRQGQQIIGRFASPVFSPAPLPPPGEVSRMAFVVRPAASDPGAFGGFGDLLRGAIDVGGRKLSELFAPRREVERLPGLQQASFLPILPGAARELGRRLPQIGGAIGLGAAGGEIADAFQRLLASGGAGTGDDSAAFTDAIPGSCRPKAHVKVNPCTGKETWFSPRGRAMLFSGDLATCKRVARVNKRVQKAMPGKHHHHRKAAKR